MVRLCRTFSNLISTGEARCAGCLGTRSGWFKYSEPPRTFSNHIFAELARCVEVFHVSSGWFDCAEPALTTSLKGKLGVQGAYALVRGGSRTANLLEPQQRRENKVCRVLPQEFGVVRLCRTFSNVIYTGEARCAGCFCTRSGWFTYIEPPRTFSNHIIAEIARCRVFSREVGVIRLCRTCSNVSFTGEARCAGCLKALVRGGSSTSNLIEPSRTTSGQS